MKNVIIEQVAETHFITRPQMESAFKNIILTEHARNMFPGCNNYLDVWQHRLSDKFFDMSTMTRMGSSIEFVLRDFYMEKKGYLNISELKKDPMFTQGIFQRIMPRSNNNAIDLFMSIGFDITAFPEFTKIQEIMLHRHLYAHNSGIIDDKYISDIKKLTGLDLTKEGSLSSYPDDDTFYFNPLKESNITDYIETIRRFSRFLS
jgi:hypothetical protein